MIIDVYTIYIQFTILCFEVDFIYCERYSLFIEAIRNANSIVYLFLGYTCGNDSELEFGHHRHFPIVTAHKVPGYHTINLLLCY
jgi:hypothetical protein